MGIYRRCIQRRYLYTALALAWAVGVSAEQYGGGVMPQYGGADYEHDYGVRSPDASAALDYKYHEEPRANDVAKFSEDAERNRRRKWSRVERKREQEDTEDSQEVEDNALESEARRGRRRRQRRGRNRRDEKRPPDADSRRRPPLASHRSADRPLKLHPNHQYHDNIEYQNYGNKYPDDDSIADETKVIHGRKPRQRIFAPPPPNRMPESTSSKINDEFVADEDEDKSLRVLPPKDEAKDEFDYSSGEDRDQINRSGRMWPASIGRMRPEDQGLLRATLPSITRDSGPDSDVENPMLKWKSLKSTANYPEYSEYSAKNNENIQNRLPTFLRRPTTTTKERPRLFSAGNVMPWPGRRAGQLGVRPDDLPRPSKPTKTTATTTVSITRTTPSTASSKHTSPPVSRPSNDTALSMEDKSRLSILKKALMKENSFKGMTKKPPVLMQVSVRQVPTLVMVAHSTGDPWFRARVVSDDSPEVLNKVKRLMRQKLVARSKDIRELTDNWDEMICDYIDVGILEPMSASNEAGYTLTVRALLLCVGFLVSIFS